MTEPQPAASVPTPQRPSMPPVTGIGLALAIVSGALTIGMLAILAFIVWVFAAVGPEPPAWLVAIVELLILGAVVTGFVLTWIGIARGRAWSRFVFAALVAATVVVAIFASDGGVPWVALPGVAALVLLFLPPSNRWFTARGEWRRAEASQAAAA